jgi:hypothetical protein
MRPADVRALTLAEYRAFLEYQRRFLTARQQEVSDGRS